MIVIIVGASGAGKTTIGRKLAALYREAGREADAVRVEALVAAFAEAEGNALEK